MRSFLLFLLAGSIPLFMHAQEHSLGGLAALRVGLKVGANLSKLDGNSWEDGYRSNFLGGVYLGISAARIGGQIEGLFVQSTYTTGRNAGDLGINLLNSASDSAKKGSFQVSYLSIPLLFQFKVGGPLWLQLGPQYSGVVSVEDKNELFKDAKELFKSGQIAAVGGIWVNIRHFNLGFRYVLNLTDINNIKGASESWKEHAIQVHLGYSF